MSCRSLRSLAALHIDVEDEDDESGAPFDSEGTEPGLWIGGGSSQHQPTSNDDAGPPERSQTPMGAWAEAAIRHSCRPPPPPQRSGDGAESGWDEAWKTTTLASFLPDFLLSELVDDQETGSGWEDEPLRRHMVAAVAMVDLCGFTRLAERLKNEHCSLAAEAVSDLSASMSGEQPQQQEQQQQQRPRSMILPRRQVKRLRSFDGSVPSSDVPALPLPMPPPPGSYPQLRRRAQSLDLSDVGFGASADSENMNIDLTSSVAELPQFTQQLAPPAPLGPSLLQLPACRPSMRRQRSGSVPWDILEAQRQESAVRAGTEELHGVVGKLFGELMAHIVECGGDVVRLAGDAIIVLFPVAQQPQEQQQQEQQQQLSLHDLNGGQESRLGQKLLQHHNHHHFSSLFRRRSGSKTAARDSGKDDANAAEAAAAAAIANARAAGKDPTLGDAVRRAVSAGLEAVRRFNGAVYHGEQTKIRVGVAAGPVEALVVGGGSHGWQHVVAGPPLGELSCLLEDGREGDVVVTPGCWKAVGAAAAASAGWAACPLASGNLVIDVEVPAGVLAEEASWSIAERQALGGGMERRRKRLARLTAGGPSQLELLRLFVPQCVLYSCEAEGSGWFSSIQRLSVVFAKVGAGALVSSPGKALGADKDSGAAAGNGSDGTESDGSDLDALERTQAAFVALQGATVRYHGVVKELTVDDKGMVFVAAFGLPPSIGDNHPEQAVLAAVAMTSAVGGAAVSAGVSTGTAFTASVGNERRELALFGDAVNVAARLMARRFLRHAKPPQLPSQSDTENSSEPVVVFGPVMVDETTAELAQPALRFERACRVQVKGRNEEVTIYTPVGRAEKGALARVPLVPSAAALTLPAAAAAAAAAAGSSTSPGVLGSGGNLRAPVIVGRKEQSDAVTRRVVQLATGRGGGLVVLDGVPGSGRRSLLRGLGEAWREGAPAVVILGGGDDDTGGGSGGGGGGGGGRAVGNGGSSGNGGGNGGAGGSSNGSSAKGPVTGPACSGRRGAALPLWALASWRPVVIGAMMQLRDEVLAFAGFCEAAERLPRSESLSPPSSNPLPCGSLSGGGGGGGGSNSGSYGSGNLFSERDNRSTSATNLAAAAAGAGWSGSFTGGSNNVERATRTASATALVSGKAPSRRLGGRGRSRGTLREDPATVASSVAAVPEYDVEMSGSFDFRGCWDLRASRIESLDLVPQAQPRFSVFHPQWEYAFLGGCADDAVARGHFLHFLFEAFLPDDFSSYWALASFLGTEMPGCYHGNLFPLAWEGLPAPGSNEASEALATAIAAVVSVLIDHAKPKIVLLLDDAVAQEEPASVRLLEELVSQHSNALLAVVASPPLPPSLFGAAHSHLHGHHGGSYHSHHIHHNNHRHSGGGGGGASTSSASGAVAAAFPRPAPPPPMLADGLARERELLKLVVEAFVEGRDPVLRARNKLRAWFVRLGAQQRRRWAAFSGGPLAIQRVPSTGKNVVTSFHGSEAGRSGGAGAGGGSGSGAQNGLLKAAVAVVMASGTRKTYEGGEEARAESERPRRDSEPTSLSWGRLSAGALTPTAAAAGSGGGAGGGNINGNGASANKTGSHRQRRRRSSVGTNGGLNGLISGAGSVASSRPPSVGGSLPVTPRHGGGGGGGGGLGAALASAARQGPYVGLPTTETLARAVARLHRKLGDACQVVSLGPLSRQETALLCAIGLNVARVSRDVSDAVYERSSGHPAATLAFCRFLRDKKLGAVTLSPGGGDVGVWEAMPGVSLHKVLSREVRPVQAKAVGFLNLMSSQQQWLLKVLSCFGQSEVALSSLESVYPIPLDGRRTLEEDACVLEDCHVLSRRVDTTLVGLGGAGVGWSEDVVLSFESPFMQQVVFSLVPAAKRRELEAAIEERKRRRARRQQLLLQQQQIQQQQQQQQQQVQQVQQQQRKLLQGDSIQHIVHGELGSEHDEERRDREGSTRSFDGMMMPPAAPFATIASGGGGGRPLASEGRSNSLPHPPPASSLPRLPSAASLARLSSANASSRPPLR